MDRLLVYGIGTGIAIGATVMVVSKIERTGNITHKWTEGGSYLFEIDGKLILPVDGAEYSRNNVGDKYSFQWWKGTKR